MARPASLTPHPPLPQGERESKRFPLSRPQGEGPGVRDHRALLRCGSTVVLLAIVALAAALRLLHLASNPGWDGDEGYNYNIAYNMAHGHHQMFALDFVFVQHPPLFFALAAGLFRLLGPSMLALRLLSVAFCLGTLALLPALARALLRDEGTSFARPQSAWFALPASIVPCGHCSPTPTSGGGGAAAPPHGGPAQSQALQLDRVSFAYRAEEGLVLDQISLDVAP